MIAVSGLVWYHPPEGGIGLQPVRVGLHNETANGYWVTWCQFPNEPGSPSLQGSEADMALAILIANPGRR